MRAAAAAEARRQEQEREEREKKRYASELAAMKERHLRERIAHISQTMHGKKVLQKLDEEVGGISVAYRRDGSVVIISIEKKL